MHNFEYLKKKPSIKWISFFLSENGDKRKAENWSLSLSQKEKGGRNDVESSANLHWGAIESIPISHGARLKYNGRDDSYQARRRVKGWQGIDANREGHAGEAEVSDLDRSVECRVLAPSLRADVCLAVIA